ncbi:hypothetical protein D3C78_1036070 [compost metagenome]
MIPCPELLLVRVRINFFGAKKAFAFATNYINLFAKTFRLREVKFSLAHEQRYRIGIYPYESATQSNGLYPGGSRTIERV